MLDVPPPPPRPYRCMRLDATRYKITSAPTTITTRQNKVHRSVEDDLVGWAANARYGRNRRYSESFFACRLAIRPRSVSRFFHDATGQRESLANF